MTLTWAFTQTGFDLTEDLMVQAMVRSEYNDQVYVGMTPQPWTGSQVPRIYYSVDGLSYTVMSRDTPPGFGDIGDRIMDFAEHWTSETDHYLYAITSYGKVFRIHNGETTWHQMCDLGLNGVTSQTDTITWFDGKLWVGGTDYTNKSVWYSTDNGATWTPVAFSSGQCMDLYVMGNKMFALCNATGGMGLVYGKIFEYSSDTHAWDAGTNHTGTLGYQFQVWNGVLYGLVENLYFGPGGDPGVARVIKYTNPGWSEVYTFDSYGYTVYANLGVVTIGGTDYLYMSTYDTDPSDPDPALRGQWAFKVTSDPTFSVVTDEHYRTIGDDFGMITPRSQSTSTLYTGSQMLFGGGGYSDEEGPKVWYTTISSATDEDLSTGVELNVVESPFPEELIDDEFIFGGSINIKDHLSLTVAAADEITPNMELAVGEAGLFSLPMQLDVSESIDPKCTARTAEEIALQIKKIMPHCLKKYQDKVLEAIYLAIGKVFERFETDTCQLSFKTFLEFADGDWLDLHASDYGTMRAKNEDDPTLRARLRRIADKVTKPSIEIAVNDVLLVGSSIIREGQIDTIFCDRDTYYDRWYMFEDDGARLFVVVVPPQYISGGNDYYDKYSYLDHNSFWGAAGEEVKIYGQLYDLINRLRAAGVQFRIEIKL